MDYKNYGNGNHYKQIYTFFFPQECCYSVFGFFSLGPLIRRIPDAGSTLSANPFFQPVDYYIENQRPKEACCASGHCDWYYTYRPRPFFCSRFIPVRTGQFFNRLRCLKYTSNNIWYILHFFYESEHWMILIHLEYKLQSNFIFLF